MKKFLMALTIISLPSIAIACSEEESSTESITLSTSSDGVINFKDHIMRLSDRLALDSLRFSAASKKQEGRLLNLVVRELNSVADNNNKLEEFSSSAAPLHGVLTVALNTVDSILRDKPNKQKARNGLSELKDYCFGIEKELDHSDDFVILTRKGKALRYDLFDLYNQIEIKMSSLPSNQQNKLSHVLKEINTFIINNNYLNDTARLENPLHFVLTEATRAAEKIILDHPNNKKIKTNAKEDYQNVKNFCFDILFSMKK